MIIMLYIAGICVAFLCIIFIIICIFYGIYRYYYKSNNTISPKRDYVIYKEYLLKKHKANYLNQMNFIEKKPVYKNYHQELIDDNGGSTDDSSISSGDISSSTDDNI
jgi:hypothetical protein